WPRFGRLFRGGDRSIRSRRNEGGQVMKTADAKILASATFGRARPGGVKVASRPAVRPQSSGATVAVLPSASPARAPAKTPHTAEIRVFDRTRAPSAAKAEPASAV